MRDDDRCHLRTDCVLRKGRQGAAASTARQQLQGSVSSVARGTVHQMFVVSPIGARRQMTAVTVATGSLRISHPILAQSPQKSIYDIQYYIQAYSVFFLGGENSCYIAKPSLSRLKSCRSYKNG
jgi:hypothetical protein